MRLLWLALASGCAGGRTGKIPGPPAPSSAASAPAAEDPAARQRLLEDAEAEFAQGREHFRQGHLELGRRSFDRAVDILLDAPRGARGDSETERLYTRLLNDIHALELVALGEGDGFEPVQDEPASIDELAGTVSFPDEAPVEPSPRPGPAADFDIPVDYNNRVAAVVELFRVRLREWFATALGRSGRYMDHIRQVFREEGLPSDLAYLAMIESAFKPHALSRARARGLWQFISGTGRLYGLKQDWWIDERADPEKSTRAAARYLKDLYARFGDWYLTMAAYNAGAGKVERAIARARTRDFWELARTRFLRRETKSYVPMILAAIVIAKDPAGYGFEVAFDPPRQYDVAQVDWPVDLRTVSECAGAPVEEILELNPELRRMTTPANRQPYALRVPKGSLERFSEALASIPPERRVRFRTHEVRPGDTLSRIARRYGTTVAAVAEANGLRLRSLIRPGQALIIPVSSRAPELAQRKEAFSAAHSPSGVAGPRTHLVRPGDTLSDIAREYRVSLAELRAWNGLEGRSFIHAGQVLLVEGASSSDLALRRLTYRVRRGDTLSTIARRFSVSVEQIRQWNNLSRDQILAGESLTIYAGSP